MDHDNLFRQQAGNQIAQRGLSRSITGERRSYGGLEMNDSGATYDAKKNRINLKMAGFFNAALAQTVYDQLMAAVDKTKPGFTLLNDIREFKPAGDEVQAIIGKAMQQVSLKKPSKVARVAGALSGLQFGRLGKEKAGYEVGTFPTMEEAEKFLNE
jgi:hypothetical protein